MGRECYHCKQWIEEGEPHDCWTTTEAALTGDLPEDLQDAWKRLREAAASLGEQRIYASHKSIMFSRKSCYFFVRPKRTCLELCIFLGRALKAPQVRRVDRASKSKLAHFIRIAHRDEVEPPLTDWLRAAYDLSGVRASKRTSPPAEARPTAGATRGGRTASPRGSAGRRPAGRRDHVGRARQLTADYRSLLSKGSGKSAARR